MLPAPLGPIIATIFPDFTDAVTLSQIVVVLPSFLFSTFTVTLKSKTLFFTTSVPLWKSLPDLPLWKLAPLPLLRSCEPFWEPLMDVLLLMAVPLMDVLLLGNALPLIDVLLMDVTAWTWFCPSNQYKQQSVHEVSRSSVFIFGWCDEKVRVVNSGIKRRTTIPWNPMHGYGSNPWWNVKQERVTRREISTAISLFLGFALGVPLLFVTMLDFCTSKNNSAAYQKTKSLKNKSNNLVTPTSAVLHVSLSFHLS